MCHSSFVEVKRQLGKLILSFHCVGPEFELRSSDLAAVHLPAELSLISVLRNASYSSSQPTY